MAEINQSPVDLIEGESELVSGFNIEYFGEEFALIFLGEYGIIIFFSFIGLIIFTRLILSNFIIYLVVVSGPRSSFQSAERRRRKISEIFPRFRWNGKMERCTVHVGGGRLENGGWTPGRAVSAAFTSYRTSTVTKVSRDHKRH